MDPSALLRKLEGSDVSNIVPQVKAALAGAGHSSLAHRALARISNLTLKKSKDSSVPVLHDGNDILQLTLICCEAIETDTAAMDKIEVNSRTIGAFINILRTFRGSDSTLCAVKVLNAVLPIVEKMLTSMSEADIKMASNIAILTQNLVLSVNESVYKEEPQSKLLPLDLWELMLRACSLRNSDRSITYILIVMKSMLIKYENCHGLNDVKRVTSFQNTLLEKFITFSQTKLSKLDANEENRNQVFSLLLPVMWQLLHINIKSGNLTNVHHIISLMSDFVVSFFFAHSYHVKCFSIISRILKTFCFQINCLPEEKLFINEVQALLEILEDKKNMSPAFKWVLFIGGCAVASLDHVVGVAAMKSFFTNAVLSSIYFFTKSLSTLLLSCNNSLCLGPNGETCPYSGDTVRAFKTVNTFIVLCVDFKKDNREEWSQMLPLIQGSFDTLELILSTAFEGKCVKKQLLKDAVYDNYYCVGNLCYNTNSWEHGSGFLLPAVKHMYSIDEDNNAYKQKLVVILPRLSVCYEKQGLKEEAKAAVLLQVILNIKYKLAHQKFLCDQWCMLQNGDITEAKSTEQFLQCKTLLLKSMCPQFKIRKQFVSHLMLWELSCYAQKKMNGTDFILNAWLALKSSKPSSSLLLEGSALACQALFSSSDTVDWYDFLSASLSSWLSKVNENEKAVALCSMAAHYQIKFLIMAQKHFNENNFKVEDVGIYSQNPSTVRRPQDVINPSDVCHVRSSFPNLNLHREKKLMEMLDTAVNYWNDSLEAGLSAENHSLNPIVAATGEKVLQVAYLYLLWGYNAGAARAFQVCCTFARKMSLDDLLIQGLAGLMDVVEVKKECIVEADSLLERLKDHHQITYLQNVYCTSRAFQALRTGAYSDGLKSLKTMADFNPTPSTLWCYAYAKLLEASYALLPKSKLENSQLSGSDSAYVGLIFSIHKIQDRKLSHSPLAFAAVVHQVLSTALWIGRYYLRRQMPREARCFLKYELILALRLGLATRAAEFICELAYVDLLTENVDEAVAKTIDLQTILGEADTHLHDNSLNDDSFGEFDEELIPKESVSLPKHPDAALGASPSLKTNEPLFIPFTNHPSSCACYMCRNASVQNLWLMYGHLQAKISTLRFFAHQSLDIYKHLFKAANLVCHQITVNALAPGLLLQHHQVACTRIVSKLDFVDMLVMYGKDIKAADQNKHIFGLLNDLKTYESHLLAETLEQNICIIKIMEQKEKKSNSSKTSKTLAKNSNLSTSPMNFVDKTPEGSKNIFTPLGPGKKRQPLKQVGTSNYLNVPLTDQQFYSPKAAHSFIYLLDNDDKETSQATKNNAPQKIPRMLYEVSEGASTTICVSDSEGEEVVKNVTTSKVSKLPRSFKSKTATETLSPSDKQTSHYSSKSTASTSSRPLSVRARSSAKEVVPSTRKPVESHRTTIKRGVKSASSEPSLLKNNLKPSEKVKSDNVDVLKQSKIATSRLTSDVLEVTNVKNKRQTRQNRN